VARTPEPAQSAIPPDIDDDESEVAQPLVVDRSELTRFVNAMFGGLDPWGYVSLRAFPQRTTGKPLHIEAIRLNTGLEPVIDAAVRIAAKVCNGGEPGVFAPPICTFADRKTARSADVHEAPVLSVEIDQGDLELIIDRIALILGARPTIALTSGSLWADPQTDLLHPKGHAHWRLTRPAQGEAALRMLRRARDIATLLAGGDLSATPPVHPMRWPGSWNLKNDQPVMATIIEENASTIDLTEALAALENAAQAANIPTPRNAPHLALPDATDTDVAQIAEWLSFIPNTAHVSWSDWNNCAMAIHRVTGGSDTGFEVFRAWSATSPKHDPADCRARWDAITGSPATWIGANFLRRKARENGWIDPTPEPPEGWEERHPLLGDSDATEVRPDQPPEIPVIICAAGELDRMYREAEAALLMAGAPIYQRTILVTPAVLEYDAANNRKTHSTALVAVTAPALTKRLSRVAIFKKFDARKKRHVVCDPPAKLVDIMLASRGDWRFPVVRGVLTTPTLRPDGSLLVKPGYDPVSRYYLAFPSNLVMPPIPDAPTRDEALASLARLDRLLDGYAFVKDDGLAVSRSVALAMLMTQVLRCAMPVSPLMAVSATAPGTGKSHLVDLCSHLAIGRWCPVMNAGKDDHETEKGINTKLISGIPGFSIDNVHRMLDLEALNTATERPLLSPRLFGSLTDIEVENGVVIFMTGNNLAIIGEQRRRTMLCRMDAESEQPEQRAFTSDPMQTVLADRGQYIADVLIIARAYITNGWRPNIPPFGSYPEWSRFVREPLCWLGQPDPVLSQKAARENDPEINQRRAIIDAWHAAFGLQAHTLAEAAHYATTVPVHPGYGYGYGDTETERATTLAAYLAHKEHQERLLGALREAFPAGRDGINTHAWGHWMRRFEGRLTDGLKFVRTPGLSHYNTARWRLAQ
jgi:putative DNA primase/helicase